MKTHTMRSIQIALLAIFISLGTLSCVIVPRHHHHHDRGRHQGWEHRHPGHPGPKQFDKKRFHDRSKLEKQERKHMKKHLQHEKKAAKRAHR